jgi:hypothetical protein
MFVKKIKLTATVDSFTFTDGKSDFCVDTKIFLGPEGLIAGVGSKPTDTGNYEEMKLFEGLENSFDFLIAAVHHGLQQFRGRFRILPSHVDVYVSQDLVSLLRGFERPIFEQVCREACASTASVYRTPPLN